MRIRLLFFASLRERAGVSELERDVPAPISVAALWESLRQEHPALGDFRGSVAFAVNQRYVDSKTVLQDNDEVAFIPPVSGGSPRENV
jgi:molybdopterin converting factor subunit 1